MKRSKFTLAFTALALSTLAAPSAMAQSGRSYDGETSQPSSGSLLRQNNITSTGATVPQPGVPQGDGPTPLDNGMDRENKRIENSICKGC